MKIRTVTIGLAALCVVAVPAAKHANEHPAPNSAVCQYVTSTINHPPADTPGGSVAPMLGGYVVVEEMSGATVPAHLTNDINTWVYDIDNNPSAVHADITRVLADCGQ